MPTTQQFEVSMTAIDGRSMEDLQAMLPNIETQWFDARSALANYLMHNLEAVERCLRAEDVIPGQPPADIWSQFDLMQPDLDILVKLESVTASISVIQQELIAVNNKSNSSKSMIDLCHRLSLLEQSVTEESLLQCFRTLKDAEKEFDTAKEVVPQSQALEGFSNRILGLHEAIRLRAGLLWDHAVQFGPGEGLTIHKSPNLIDVIQVLQALEEMDAKLDSFSRGTFSYLIRPILFECTGIRIEHDSIIPTRSNGSGGLNGIGLLLKFLMKQLPAEIHDALRISLLPELLEVIQQEYFPVHLPIEQESSADFHNFVRAVVAFDANLHDSGFLQTSRSTGIEDGIPWTWLEGRRSAILSECRNIVLSWTGMIESTEQSNTVSDSLRPKLAHDPMPEAVRPSVDTVSLVESREDDIADNWNIDWDIEDDSNSITVDVETTGRDKESNVFRSDPSNQISLSGATRGSIMITTKYAISTIPQNLLNLIHKCQDEAKNVAASKGILAVTAEKLHRVETEILDCYRALSPLLIRTVGYPRMIIYNDCIFLANNVSEPDAIRMFGESFYSAEVQEKKTQIFEIMQGANEFVSCTVPSQNQACYSSIQQILDLLRRLHERYEGQLPQTTMFTALGTLVEAAIVTMMESIMDMTDISAAESTDLAKMGDALAVSEELFRTNNEPMPLAAMWCPSWFKFRLLLDILEAKLDYILELWRAGSLVDFTPQELCDLIRALFSDSVKRRATLETITSGLAPVL